MKTFDELTAQQQSLACEVALLKILAKISEGSARFPGLPSIQAKLEAAAAEDERLKSPSYMHQFVLNNYKAELDVFAGQYARSAFYREPGDLVLSL